jgi:TolB-like protein
MRGEDAPAVLGLITIALTFASSPSTEAKTRILVLDVAGSALSKEEAGAIRDRLAAVVAKRKTVDVISSEDMRRLLDVEGQKQAAGCDGGSDCLAEIGAALGADGVMYASVAKLGDRFVVNISLVDPKNARAAGRDTFEADAVDKIDDELPASAARVFGSKPPPPPPSKPFPILTVGGGVVAVAGAAAAGVLGYYTYQAEQTVSDPNASGVKKARAVTDGQTEEVGAIASAGAFGIGAVVFLFGLFVE